MKHTDRNSFEGANGYSPSANWITFSKRRELVKSWSSYVEEHVREGWTAYLLTFQFREIGGSAQHVGREMEKELERVYAKLLTRIVRRPHSWMNTNRLPKWIACPDFPVRKLEKTPVGDFCVNGGRHIHAICLIPPKSRLGTPLDEHFEDNASLYIRPRLPLVRLHAKPITETPGNATDYVLTALKSGRALNDDVLVLPRSADEVSERGRNPRG